MGHVTVAFRGRSLHLQNVLLDTGSAGTVFSADRLAGIGVEPEPLDVTHLIRGIGGTEFVYSKTLESITMDNDVGWFFGRNRADGLRI
ncbi:MAG: aspartyl protease family protein [Thermaerobacter sp.]|nr:aspartyl protease family protein [Thermaerobacter sp.]